MHIYIFDCAHCLLNAWTRPHTHRCLFGVNNLAKVLETVATGMRNGWSAEGGFIALFCCLKLHYDDGAALYFESKNALSVARASARTNHNKCLLLGAAQGHKQCLEMPKTVFSPL